MATKRVVIPGIVKNGIVVPQNDTPLPDSAHVKLPGRYPPQALLHIINPKARPRAEGVIIPAPSPGRWLA